MKHQTRKWCLGEGNEYAKKVYNEQEHKGRQVQEDRNVNKTKVIHAALMYAGTEKILENLKKNCRKQASREVKKDRKEGKKQE